MSSKEFQAKKSSERPAQKPKDPEEERLEVRQMLAFYHLSRFSYYHFHFSHVCICLFHYEGITDQEGIQFFIKKTRI